MTETAVIAGTLSGALKALDKSIDSKPTLPVLSCVRLRAADGAKRLSIEVTNLETSQRVTIPCATLLSEFDTVVPYRTLKDWVALSNPMHRLDLHSDSTTAALRVKDISDHANFKGIDPAEFPLLPTIDSTWQHVATWQEVKAWRYRPASGGVKALKAEVELLARYSIPDSDKWVASDNFGRFLRLKFTPDALHLRGVRPTALAERLLTDYPSATHLEVDVPSASFSAALTAHAGESDCVEVLMKPREDGTMWMCLKSSVREVFMQAHLPKADSLKTPELLWRGEADGWSLLSLLSKLGKKDTLNLTFDGKGITLATDLIERREDVRWSKSVEVEFVPGAQARYKLTGDELALAAYAVKAQKKALSTHLGLAMYDDKLPMLVIYSPHGAEYIVLTNVKRSA